MGSFDCVVDTRVHMRHTCSPYSIHKLRHYFASLGPSYKLSLHNVHVSLWATLKPSILTTDSRTILLHYYRLLLPHYLPVLLIIRLELVRTFLQIDVRVRNAVEGVHGARSLEPAPRRTGHGQTGSLSLSDERYIGPQFPARFPLRQQFSCTHTRGTPTF